MRAYDHISFYYTMLSVFSEPYVIKVARADYLRLSELVASG